MSDVQAFIELEDFDPKAIDKNGGQMAQAMFDWVQILYQNYCREQALAEIATQMEALDQEQKDLDEAEASAKREIAQKQTQIETEKEQLASDQEKLKKLEAEISEHQKQIDQGDIQDLQAQTTTEADSLADRILNQDQGGTVLDNPGDIKAQMMDSSIAFDNEMSMTRYDKILRVAERIDPDAFKRIQKQNEREQANLIMNLTRSCKQNGRCPKCTLIPPCKHIKTNTVTRASGFAPLRGDHNLNSRFDSSQAFQDSPKQRGANRPDIATHYQKMSNIMNVRRSHNISGQGKLSDADLKQSYAELGSMEQTLKLNKTSKLRHIHSRKLFGQSLDNVRFFKQEQKRLRSKDTETSPRQPQ